ncbi:MBL fold metallo-hydrolase [candidate division KSB1 bacterium]|nr:MBL fold metallo-hydrolase [candidate division KSB1 bacterium]
MHFRQFLHSEKGCISYAMGCPSQGVCAIIDPQGDPRFYVDHCEENAMVVKQVLETHAHADHFSCARRLAELTASPLYLGANAEVHYPFEPLADRQEFMFGRWRGEILHTPGHTPEHISILIEDWFLLTGDLLFVGDVGRIDLSLAALSRKQLEMRARIMYGSLQKLMTLPEWTEVYPGHYRGSVCGRGLDDKTVSTLGRERRLTPALGMSEAEFIEFQLTNLPPLPEDFHRIKQHNLGAALAAQTI